MSCAEKPELVMEIEVDFLDTTLNAVKRTMKLIVLYHKAHKIEQAQPFVS